MEILNDSSKRRYPRTHFKKPIAFTCKGYSEVSAGLEIGEGGISLQTEMSLDMESAIVVNFYIPDGGFHCLRAIVKSTLDTPATKPGHIVYGLSFTEVSLSLKRQIRAYVARTSHEQEKFKVLL
jgi:hypothetical protein